MCRNGSARTHERETVVAQVYSWILKLFQSDAGHDDEVRLQRRLAVFVQVLLLLLEAFLSIAMSLCF